MNNTLMKLTLSEDRPSEEHKSQVEMNQICSQTQSLEVGQKLCKECGLPFTPKGRESYCTRDHYRPCPVCNTQVLIKYLSDPTPCCSKECTKIKRSGNRKKMLPPSSVTTSTNVSIDFTSGEKRKYVGRDGVMGLKREHIYSIEISKEPVYGNYNITATYDFTEDKTCDCTITCCSMLNINNNVFVTV